MPTTRNSFGDTPNEHWGALLRAPITTVECAFLGDPETEQDQIVVMYNARDTPPVVTIDVNLDQSLVTLKADGTPLAVMSCQSNQVPSADDVMLVARHIPYNA